MNKYSEYDFGVQVEQWSRPPVDGRGYFPSRHLMDLSRDEVMVFVERFEVVRYGLRRWRNDGNGWRHHLGLDTTEGKHILDYGCGYGIDALQFARKGNRITFADISQDNLDTAERVLNTYGYESEGKVLISEKYPFHDVEEIDVFFASGALHHMPLPMAEEVLGRTHPSLTGNGEIRLLLHSDLAWKELTGTADIYEDPQTNLQFKRFVRKMDAVGYYSDWYNKAKVELLLGKYYSLADFAVIARGKLCVAILRKKL